MTAHHHTTPRPFVGGYEVARKHLADRPRVRALIDGSDEQVDDDPRCFGCGCWLGYGERAEEPCDGCRFGEDA